MGAIIVLSVFAAVIYFIARIKYLKGKEENNTKNYTSKVGYEPDFGGVFFNCVRVITSMWNLILHNLNLKLHSTAFSGRNN